jgi:hypothetical protein
MNRLTVLSDCLLPISGPFLNSLALFKSDLAPDGKLIAFCVLDRKEAVFRVDLETWQARGVRRHVRRPPITRRRCVTAAGPLS